MGQTAVDSISLVSLLDFPATEEMTVCEAEGTAVASSLCCGSAQRRRGGAGGAAQLNQSVINGFFPAQRPNGGSLEHGHHDLTKWTFRIMMTMWTLTQHDGRITTDCDAMRSLRTKWPESPRGLVSLTCRHASAAGRGGGRAGGLGKKGSVLEPRKPAFP